MTVPDRIEIAEASHGLQPDSEAMLVSLRTMGGMRFDPVRFRYIEALEKRAREHQGIARRVLDARLAQALIEFKERFAKARAEADDTVVRCVERFPHVAGDLQSLMDAGDFKGVRRVVSALENREKAAGLASLLRRLEQSAPEKSDARGGTNAGPRTELRAIRNFRQTWSKLSVDNQVAKVLRQAPKNAGPINSHMLVLRSLSMMRDISPDYLNRFISYTETLLCLDPGEPEKPVSPKKPPATKTAKRSSKSSSRTE